MFQIATPLLIFRITNSALLVSFSPHTHTLSPDRDSQLTLVNSTYRLNIHQPACRFQKIERGQKKKKQMAPTSNPALLFARNAAITAAPHIARRGLTVNSTQGTTLGAIAAYVVVIALLWNLPYVRWSLWPFKVPLLLVLFPKRIEANMGCHRRC